MVLKFIEFTAADFPEYRSWYEDPELNKHLGPPIDQEWLDYVMAWSDGCEYSVFDVGELVAVVGIWFPTAEHPTYTISDLAVKPQLRGRGIGSQVLADLMTLHKLSSGQSWAAYVHVSNPRAKSFLEKHGWLCKCEVPDEHGMLHLTFANPDT